MVTILESLKSVNAYPIPLRTFTETAERRGLVLTDEANKGVLAGRAYRLALADLLLWLYVAPDVSQGGQSYSFSDEQRKQFRNRANAIYNELDEVTSIAQPTFGYKGSRL